MENIENVNYILIIGAVGAIEYEYKFPFFKQPKKIEQKQNKNKHRID